jgi:hypothetical protein
MDNLHVGYDLLMHKGNFATVHLRSAQITGQLAMGQATVTGMLDMEHLYVGRDLFMHKGAQFATVNLRSA